MANWTRRGLIAAATLSAVFAGATPLLAQSDSPYEGVTIRFLTSSNASQDAFSKKLQQIGESWGMTVDIRKVTTDELQKKVVLDYVAGADTWDLIYSGGVQQIGRASCRERVCQYV